jgi:hypothetical protein
MSEKIRKPPRTREEIVRDYYLASGRANSAPTQATLDRIDAVQALEKVADTVLAYRPKSKQPKPRKRKKAKRG